MFSFLDLISVRPKNRYVFVNRLVGHSSAIYCLQANYSGTLLASGGYDGALIWDLIKCKQLQVPNHSSQPRGQVTSLRWVTGTFDIRDTLCIGTSLGWLLIWQENLEKNVFEEVFSSQICPDRITDINFDRFMDADSFRICLCARNGVIQLWNISPSSEKRAGVPTELKPRNIFSVKPPIYKPRSIGFIDDGTMQIKLRVLGRTGGMFILDGNGATLSSRMLGHVVGTSEAHDRKRLLVIDAGIEFKLYNMDPNFSFVRSFPTTTEGEHFPRQVTFGEQENVIIGGSKEGFVYVFDTNSGAPLDVLHHSPNTKVLAVTTFKRDHTNYIAAASSGDESSVIYLWSYKPLASISKRKSRSCSQSSRIFISLLAVSISIAILGFFVSLQFESPSPLSRYSQHVDMLSPWVSIAWSSVPSILQKGPLHQPNKDPVSKCQSVLDQDEISLDEWRWYSRQGSQALYGLEKESKRLRHLIEVAITELKDREQVETSNDRYRSKQSSDELVFGLIQPDICTA